MITASQRLGQTDTYYFAQKMAEIQALNEQGHSVINLGVGSPDLGPHPSVTQSLKDALDHDQAHRYQPFRGVPALAAAFAGWYSNHFGVELDGKKNILPLIGSKEGVTHISMSFLSPGDRVLVPDPGYPSYSAAAKLAGAEPVYFPLRAENHFLPDLEALSNLDLSGVKLMWINYPNMPTGGNADLPFFKRLVAFAHQHKILICHDNPYAFILNAHPINIFQAEGAMDCVLELTSCSKNYHMAGWRVGAVAGKASLLDTIARFKSNVDSGMFYPIQKAAITALGLGQDWLASIHQIYSERKAAALHFLSGLGCEVNPESAGMFVWARVPSAFVSGEALSDWALAHARIFITPGSVFGKEGDQYVRLSLCSPVEDFELAAQRWLFARQETKSVNHSSPQNENA